MREQYGAEHVDAIAAAHAPLDAAVIAEAIHRDDRGFFERRDEEGAGQVRAMVLHLVDVGRASTRRESCRDVPGSGGPPGRYWRLCAAERRQEAGRRAAHNTLRPMCAKGLREMATCAIVVPIRAVQTGGRGEIGESGPVLDAVQAFFFDCRHEVALRKQSGRSVAVKGV